MCDIATIAGIALSGVSTALNSAAQAKVSRARDDAMAAERIRQNSYDQQTDALNEQSRARYDNVEQQRTEKSSQLADYFTSQEVPQPSAEAAIPTSASNITVNEEQKQRAKAKEFTNRTGTALGDLRSFGDLLGGINRKQALDASQIGQIGGFKRGSSNVLSYELDHANQAGNGLRTFADIASGLGGTIMNAGLSGGSLFGAPASSAGAVKAGSVAAGRALDRASVPGYTARSGLFNLYG